VLYALTFSGGLYMAFRSVEELTLGLESRSWPTVDGRVLQDDRSRRFYGYLVDDKAYAGERIRFPAGLPGRPPGELPMRYEYGQRVVVHYAPDAPHIAVIEPGVWVPGMAAGFGMAAIMLPAGALGLLRWRRGRRTAQSDSQT